MKSIFGVICIGCLLLTGCATDTAYGIAKGGVNVGKAVVEANKDKINQDTLDKLETGYDYAVRYDQARTVVKEATDGK